MNTATEPNNDLKTTMEDRTIIRWYMTRFNRNINFKDANDYFWIWRQRFAKGLEFAICHMDNASRETLKKVLFENY